jgi:hypothetical protein
VPVKIQTNKMAVAVLVFGRVLANFETEFSKKSTK